MDLAAQRNIPVVYPIHVPHQYLSTWLLAGSSKAGIVSAHCPYSISSICSAMTPILCDNCTARVTLRSSEPSLATL